MTLNACVVTKRRGVIQLKQTQNVDILATKCW